MATYPSTSGEREVEEEKMRMRRKKRDKDIVLFYGGNGIACLKAHNVIMPCIEIIMINRKIKLKSPFMGQLINLH